MLLVKSEGKGSYGKKICNNILQKIFPDIKIKWVDKPPFNLIVQSHFSKEEPVIKYPYKIPYILYNGESYPIKSRKLYPPLLHITSIKSECNRQSAVYIPYLAMTPWDPNILLQSYRLQQSLINKKFFLGYCSSNCQLHREQIFNAIRSINPRESHSFGKCQNNMPRINGSWKKMINVFKNYRFVLAVENTQADGYITEKIMIAFLSGAIPIYWGDKNIENIFNVKAFINMNRFKSLAEVVQHLNYLENNKNIQQKIRGEPIFNGNPPEYMNFDSTFYQQIADNIKDKIFCNK